MLILADLGPDPKHWPSEAATAADQSDDHGALLAFGGRNSGRRIGGVWGGGGAPQEGFSCEPPPVVRHVINANLPNEVHVQDCCNNKYGLRR